MKPKKLKAKLSLGKEKIKSMDESEMKEIKGGAFTEWCTITKFGCITMQGCSWLCDTDPIQTIQSVCYA